MTGAEALQKIIDEIENLKSVVTEMKNSVQLIEANIKTLNNRAGALMADKAPVTPPMPSLRAEIPPKPLSELMEQPQEQAKPLLKASSTQEWETIPVNHPVSQNDIFKKVYGRLLNKNGEPIENVLIKIYDHNNEICATSVSDKTGKFDAMVKDGRYSVEYSKEGFKSTNKTFELKKHMQELEIK